MEGGWGGAGGLEVLGTVKNVWIGDLCAHYYDVMPH